MSGNQIFSELSKAMVSLFLFFLQISQPSIFLNLEKHLKKEGTSEWAILLSVEAKNQPWVRVMEGESLMFLLDDKGMELATSGSFKTDYDMMDDTIHH